MRPFLYASKRRSNLALLRSICWTRSRTGGLSSNAHHHRYYYYSQLINVDTCVLIERPETLIPTTNRVFLCKQHDAIMRKRNNNIIRLLADDAMGGLMATIIWMK